MKVKVFDEQHEKDLENEINFFLEKLNKEIYDIKFSTTAFNDGEEQVFCFSALIMYE